jgi:hypothetical protein
MGEVHGGICGTHQSAHKMKWLLCCAGFNWPTLNDCFRYYKGCESCQMFRDVKLAPAAMLHPIIKPWLCLWLGFTLCWTNLGIATGQVRVG